MHKTRLIHDNMQLRNHQNKTEAQKPSNWVPILDKPLFAERKLRVVCIGAGFSGLILAHKIKYDWKMDDFIELQIYEKNDDIGGTWYENRYPGAAW